MCVGLCVALLVVAILHSLGTRAKAAEVATGVYLLGSRTVGAGIAPPAGVYFQYFQDDTCFDSGKTFGEPRVNATVLVNSPRLGSIGVNASGANFDMSDFFPNSFIGWHASSQVAAAKPIKTKF